MAIKKKQFEINRHHEQTAISNCIKIDFIFHAIECGFFFLVQTERLHLLKNTLKAKQCKVNRAYVTILYDP